MRFCGLIGLEVVVVVESLEVNLLVLLLPLADAGDDQAIHRLQRSERLWQEAPALHLDRQEVRPPILQLGEDDHGEDEDGEGDEDDVDGDGAGQGEEEDDAGDDEKHAEEVDKSKPAVFCCCIAQHLKLG